MGRVDLAIPTDRSRLDDGVVLPAASPHHNVCGLKLRISTFNHFTDRAAFHDLAQRLRCGITFTVVHPTPHIGVQTQKVIAHQYLTFLQGRGVRADQFEIGGARLALGTVVENNDVIGGHGVSLEGFNRLKSLANLSGYGGACT